MSPSDRVPTAPFQSLFGFPKAYPWDARNKQERDCTYIVMYLNAVVIYLSTYLPIYLSIHPSIYLSECLKAFAWVAWQ